MSARLALALSFALLSTARSATHAQTGDASGATTVVQEGDTCRSVAVRVYGDPDAIDVLHEHNPELGPTPHRLVPGTLLRTPPPRPPAEISAIVRRVERRDPEASAFADAAPGDPLARGALVRTHERASAEITFRDRARVTVREDTLVVVYGGRRGVEERPTAHAELERGALRSRLGELAGGEPLEVETPSSEATLAESGVVRVEEDGTSQIANHGDGPATVRAGGARVVLPGGTGVVVRRGERPRAPRRLLPAPRWRADHRGYVVGFVDRGGTLRGGFDAVRGAARYRVEVARRPDGGDVVAATELPGDATRIEIDGVPEGTVYVSMASIDAEGLEGRRSPWRAFSVRLARLVQPGGATAELHDGVPRVLPGTWLVSPRGLRCEDDVGLSASTAVESGIVTLRSVGRHAVRCRDVEGNETAAIEVDVTAPHVAVGGALLRDRVSTLTLTLSGDPLPPADALALRVPEGFHATRVRGAEGALEADVSAPADAPERARVGLELVVGTERVELVSTEMPLRDPERPHRTVAPPLPIAGPRDERVIASGLGDLVWPSVLALRDERRRGVRGWAYLAVIASAGDGDVQARAGGGAFGHVPETSLRLSLASQGDVVGAAQPVDRRGAGDVAASLGVLALDLAEVAIAIDAAAIFPTRAEPESVGRVRLTPSAELSVRPTEWLSLRTRQGAIVDARDTGARLWSFAVGADASIGRAASDAPGIAIGAELDAAIGDFADRSGAALALGAGFELRYPFSERAFFELSLAGRVALTDDAVALLGQASGILSLRLSAQ